MRSLIFNQSGSQFAECVYLTCVRLLLQKLLLRNTLYVYNLLLHKCPQRTFIHLWNLFSMLLNGGTTTKINGFWFRGSKFRNAKSYQRAICGKPDARDVLVHSAAETIHDFYTATCTCDVTGLSYTFGGTEDYALWLLISVLVTTYNWCDVVYLKR